MATGGAGVFDNDAAMDARSNVAKHIRSAIDDFISSSGFGVEDTDVYSVAGVEFNALR